MSGDRETYQLAMREAHALAWSLKWETASQKYREALAQFPNDPTARLSLAVALTRIGRAGEALVEYERVRALLPNDTLILARIAELHARQSNVGEAVRITLEQARLHAAQKDDEKATLALRRALEYAERDRRSLAAIRDAVRNLGGRPAAAVATEIESALALAPSPVTEDAAQPSGAAEPTVGPLAAAKETEQAWSPVPDAEPQDEPQPSRASDDPSQLIEAAGRSESLGQPLIAIDQYLRASDLLDEPKATETRGRAEALLGDWSLGEIAEVAEVPAAHRLAVLEAMRNSAEYSRAGLLSLATDEAHRAVGCAPLYLPAQLRMAEIEHLAGREREALQRTDSVARLYDLRGERPRASAALKVQIALGTDRAAARRRLVDFLIESGQTARAAAELASWSDELASAGDVPRAVELRRESVRLCDQPGDWLALAVLCESAGEAQEARDAFARARELSPDDVRCLAGMNRCDAALGDWPQMEETLDQLLTAAREGRVATESAETTVGDYRVALERTGVRPGLGYCLGRLLVTVGKDAEGEAELRQLVGDESRPGRLACYYLGQRDAESDRPKTAIERLWRVGEPESAAEESDRALAIAAHRLLVDQCAKAGDWDGAARAIEGLIRVFPNEDTLHTRLAEVYFRLQRLGEAVRVLGSLAQVYAERGDLERAIAVSRGRAQIAPFDGQIRSRLGMQLLDAGRTEEGLSELDSAVKLLAADGQKDEAAAQVRVMLDACRQTDAVRAMALRETLVTLLPDDVDARLDLIESYLKAGRSVRAESEARQVVESLLSEYRLADAARALRLVTRLDPWNLDDRVRLGRVLGQLGQIEEALKTLRGVLARDPSHRLAGESLADLLASVERSASTN